MYVEWSYSHFAWDKYLACLSSGLSFQVSGVVHYQVFLTPMFTTTLGTEELL